MPSWTEQAASLEAACLKAVEGQPIESHAAIMEALCFYRWFAWRPVKTAEGKWRWMTYVKRHWSEPYYKE